MRASVRRLVAWTIAFAAALFASWPADIGASAWAQAPSDNLWTRPTLSGDWGGLRSTLECNGVTFTFNYTNDFLANVRGGIGRGAIGLGAFQPALDLDLGKLAGWGRRPLPHPRAHHARPILQSDLPRQLSDGVQSGSRTGRAA